MIAGQKLMWFGSGEDALDAQAGEYPDAVVVELHSPYEPVAWAITDDARTLAGWLASGQGRVVS